MNPSSSDLVVNAGCLLFFHDRPQNRDVVDSTLYAQLAASSEHSRFTTYPLWKKTWLKAALELGWEFQSGVSFSEPAPPTDAVSFWGLAKALRPKFVSEDFVALCEAKSLQLSSNSTALKLFADQVMDADASKVSMQLGVVDNQYNLSLLQLHFVCANPLCRSTLFGPWERQTIKGNIEFSFQRLRLSKVAYTPWRDQVVEALKDQRAELVLEVLSSGDSE